MKERVHDGKLPEHPEMKEGEMFLTNSRDEGYSHIGWKTKRKGKVAFTIHGYPVKTGLFPVFVQKEEHDAGMKKYRSGEK